MTDDLTFTPAVEQARLIRCGEVSSRELTELYLRRIDELGDQLGCFLTVAHDHAMAAAKEADEALTTTPSEALPPFHGVPTSIKDLDDTAGIRTTQGLASGADRVPDTDAHVVTRIKDAGFVILGKTNTPELGVGGVTDPPAFWPARNPWDPSLTPGGSSGGAAAAVAAGLGAVAQGSDGGGSIRIPAAFCGIVGLKPARGRILTPPGNPETHATHGPLARTVLDAAAMLDAMCGPVPGPQLWGLPNESPFAAEVGRDPGRLRVAVANDGRDLSPAIAATLSATADLLADLGHAVEACEPFAGWSRVLDEAALEREESLLWMAVRSETMRRLEGAEFRYPLNTWLLDRAEEMTALDYLAAEARIRGAFAGSATRALQAWADFDVVLTPTVAGPPLPVGLHEQLPPLELWRAMAAALPYTTLFNHTGSRPSPCRWATTSRRTCRSACSWSVARPVRPRSCASPPSWRPPGLGPTAFPRGRSPDRPRQRGPHARRGRPVYVRVGSPAACHASKPPSRSVACTSPTSCRLVAARLEE